MIKKCKQCGCKLKPEESNNLCENCRRNKRNKRLEEKNLEEARKRKKM